MRRFFNTAGPCQPDIHYMLRPTARLPELRSLIDQRNYFVIHAPRQMDICLRYGDVTLGMELKVWREGKPDPLAKGLEQLDKYLSGLGLETGWLVIFDRRPNLPPIAERTTTEEAVTEEGRAIVVIRG